MERVLLSIVRSSIQTVEFVDLPECNHPLLLQRFTSICKALATIPTLKGCKFGLGRNNLSFAQAIGTHLSSIPTTVQFERDFWLGDGDDDDCIREMVDALKRMMIRQLGFYLGNTGIHEGLDRMLPHIPTLMKISPEAKVVVTNDLEMEPEDVYTMEDLFQLPVHIEMTGPILFSSVASRAFCDAVASSKAKSLSLEDFSVEGDMLAEAVVKCSTSSMRLGKWHVDIEPEIHPSRFLAFLDALASRPGFSGTSVTHLDMTKLMEESDFDKSTWLAVNRLTPALGEASKGLDSGVRLMYHE